MQNLPPLAGHNDRASSYAFYDPTWRPLDRRHPTLVDASPVPVVGYNVH